MRFLSLAKALAGAALAGAALLPTAASAQTTDRALQKKQMAEVVDTAKFKKAGPYTIGVAAGYMSNSWVVFCLQHIRYEASLHKDVKDVIVTDAAFNPAKQVADIEDLIAKNVSLIIYWPVDEKAIQPALEKAVAKGIPTVNAGGGFSYSAGTVSNAFIDQWALGEEGARHFVKDLGGKGKIFAMLPIAGTTAAVDQLAALKSVLKDYPNVELLSAEYGDWNRAKAKQISENLLQRYPKIDGVYSPAGPDVDGRRRGVRGRRPDEGPDDVAGRRIQRLDEVGGEEPEGRRRHLPDPRRPGSDQARPEDPERRAGAARPDHPVRIHRAAGRREVRRDEQARRLVGEQAARAVQAEVIVFRLTAALLEIRGLGKRFGAVTALDGVDFSARRGEVHALTGANGAGKSTLMNVLAGVYAPGSGEIAIDGKPVRFDSPAEARAAGVAAVYQELALLPQLTVAENIWLGREPRTRWRLLDRRALNERTARLCAEYRLPPRSRPRRRLAQRRGAPAGRDRARPLDFGAHPDARRADRGALARRAPPPLRHRRRAEAARPGHHLRLAPARRGVRDRRPRDRAAQRPARVRGRDKRRHAGRAGAPHGRPRRRRPQSRRAVRAFRRAAAAGHARHVGRRRLELVLQRGEIVGLGGLVGAGRTRLARRLAGLEPGVGVDCRIGADRFSVGSAREAIARGIVYLTEDRKKDGLFSGLSVLRNASAATLARLSRAGFVDRRAERRAVVPVLDSLKLVAASLRTPVRFLSGGNQQKVLFGRALLAGPLLLICDEPTRGVDVAAREEIYALMDALARQGVTIVLVSSDLKELLALCHRILVVRNAVVVLELPASASELDIVAAAVARAPFAEASVAS